ncbi:MULTISPECIES: hypothetical protein [unclassified Bacillus cereus group]|uniref:hypothetical protein n=1 Tax=unclassified Bacillus cereus group TaxID=2750818 RepID=UPI0022E33FAE|nr:MULTISPECIES: hypothetical protein [unclassified Bacillus cereus group]MDA2260842.1 hypothetical protein [Bacillus cereus group sp. Bc200]
MFKGEIKDTPQNNDSTGIYITASTRNIDLPTKMPIPFLYTKRLLQIGTTSLSIPEPSQ